MFQIDKSGLYGKVADMKTAIALHYLPRVAVFGLTGASVSHSRPHAVQGDPARGVSDGPCGGASSTVRHFAPHETGAGVLLI